MSITQVSSATQTALDERLNAIVRALTELNRCVEERKYARTQEEKIGVFLGECDWRAELERCLYENV